LELLLVNAKFPKLFLTNTVLVWWKIQPPDAANVVEVAENYSMAKKWYLISENGNDQHAPLQSTA